MTTTIAIQPNAEVVAARAALDEAIAALDAISTSYPPSKLDGEYNPVWIAYVHQEVRIDLAFGTLDRAVRKHYSELTGIHTAKGRTP